MKPYNLISTLICIPSHCVLEFCLCFYYFFLLLAVTDLRSASRCPSPCNKTTGNWQFLATFWKQWWVKNMTQAIYTNMVPYPFWNLKRFGRRINSSKQTDAVTDTSWITTLEIVLDMKKALLNGILTFVNALRYYYYYLNKSVPKQSNLFYSNLF